MDLSYNPDIQSLIFRSAPALKQARYVLFAVDDLRTFRRWLRGAVDGGLVSSAAQGTAAEGDVRVNIAFTASGLERLLGRGWMPETFEPAFVEGMVTPHRSRLLGDVEVNDPEGWRWRGDDGTADGLLLVFAGSEPALDATCARCLGSEHGTRSVLALDGFHQTIEPFGFVDGISQPLIEDTRKFQALKKSARKEEQRAAELSRVPTGEIILGYPDGSGRLPRTPATTAALDSAGWLQPHPEQPERRDFGRDGTYLVFRQLEQFPERLRAFLAAITDDEAERDLIAEKMVGRKRDGRALEPIGPPAGADWVTLNNVFDFASKTDLGGDIGTTGNDDIEGRICPIGSHIRRSNPRATGVPDQPDASLEVSRRHRILRRGRIYGGAEGEPTGLHLVCLNASIGRQFEFVQGTWCNNRFFHGLDREVDPIVGTRRPEGRGLLDNARFTIPEDPYRRCLVNLPDFVEVKGGGYFFLPGMKALRFLTDIADSLGSGESQDEME